MRASIIWVAFAMPFAAGASVLAEGPAGRPDRPLGPPRIPLMAAIDSSGDGELSAEEIAAAAEAVKKLDKNGDGKLSQEELRPASPPRPGPGGRGPGGAGDSMERPALGKDEAEKKVLKAIDDIVREQGRRMNVPNTDGRLLRLLAETIEAKSAVEIGTSNGISAIWTAAALRKTGGRLVTFEIDPKTAAIARENFARAGVADLVTVVEGDAHEKVKELKGPIDMVFIDADKEGYLDYLKKLLPLVRPGGLVLAHNMNPRMADGEFLKAITTDPALETIFYREGGGMSVTLKKR